MFFASLLFAVGLQQCGPYNGPSDGAIHLCGHAYKVICTRSGSPADCEDSEAFPAQVNHFEVRDENGRIVFASSVSAGQLFTRIFISGAGYPGHPHLLTVDVERQTNEADQISSTHYQLYLASTPSGLVAFQPALSCGEGRIQMLSNPAVWPPAGIALGCQFDAGYFRFVAMLEFDFDRHQIILGPNKVLNLSGPAEMSAETIAASALRVYKNHEENAPRFTIALARGQTTKLLAAWAPVLLRSSADVAVTSYDPEKLWLQIELKNEKVWIRGGESFQAIGLHLASGP
jgi:hypothetical protein